MLISSINHNADVISDFGSFRVFVFKGDIPEIDLDSVDDRFIANLIITLHVIEDQKLFEKSDRTKGFSLVNVKIDNIRHIRKTTSRI